MEEFYKTLEVTSNASDAEIKQSYIKLKNKFDPNNYEKADLKQIAIEKTKQLDRAFDEIMNKRRLDRIQHGQSTSDSNSQSTNQSYSRTTYENGFNSDLNYIENLINSGNFDEALRLLDSVNENSRPAHWFYLKGVVLLKKGWLEEAYNFLQAAVRMDPQNRNYVNALNQLNWQRKGVNNPYGKSPYFGNSHSYSSQSSSCGFCDSCMGFMCANAICSCCEDGALGGC